jgi:endonuclease/exonuclease/phosphatase family metal-dependent hydrolase
MRKHLLPRAVLFCVLAAGTAVILERTDGLQARAQTNGTCTVVEDTRLEQKNPDHIYGLDPSSLGLTLWAAGNVNSVGQMAAAALRFDCSSIPDGATLLSATLDIFVNFGTSGTYQIFELEKPWTESAATWNQYAAGAPWGVAGARDTRAASADYAKPLLATLTGASANAIKSIPLTTAGLNAVRSWVNGGANNGILLRPPLDDGHVGFHSSETGTVANRPVLEVVSAAGTFTLPVAADARLEEKAQNQNYATHTTLYGAGNVNDIGHLAEAALRFDVSSIPPGTSIQSATLKITISAVDSPTDTYELFELKKPWTENGATWINYAAGIPWDVPGAKGANDRASTVLGSMTGASLGTKRIDLNAAGISLLSGWVNGTTSNNGILFRSRLSNDDFGFHSRANTTPPVLRVVYDLTPSTTATTFTALHWNIHHGVTKDSGICVLDDMTTFVAQSEASIVGLNEVEYKRGYCTNRSNGDEPLEIETLLRQKTGRAWSRLYASVEPLVPNVQNQGNLILYMSDDPTGNDARPGFDLLSQDIKELENEATNDQRSAGRVTLRSRANSNHVVTFVSTHLIVSNASMAQLQAREIRDWVAAEAEARIVTGDWNAGAGDGAVKEMTPTYFDSYVVASTASPSRYTGKANGGTRSVSSTRIDYHFISKTSGLELLSQNNPSPKAGNGEDISDHLPVIVKYRLQ